MKKVIVFIIGLIVGLVVVKSASGQEESNSLLYKVEGNGIKASYLYGTIHLMPATEFELKEKVEKAFNESEQIVLELDMDDPSIPASMMQGALMTDGTTLDKLLTEEEYQMLDKELKASMGVGLETFNSMKPFFLSTMLMAKLVGEQPASYEGTFVQMAMANEQEILGLETVEDQLGVFDKVSYESQAEDLMEMFTEEEEMKELYKKMIEAYKAEDSETLYELLVEGYDGNQEEIGYLLDDRNQKWIPQFKVFSADKTTFYGVGAGHLEGELGVINLLRKAGYTVTAI